MSLWAVETFAYKQAQETVQVLLQRLRPSVALLGSLGHPTGSAALIDSQQGLFLAHADSVKGDTVQARLGDGYLVLSVLSRDARSSLVLLRPKAIDGPITAPALALVETNPTESSRVLVLLSNAAVLGSFIGGDKFSVGDRRPAIPVTELRFEAPSQAVSGALVFTLDGKLIGAIGSTVVSPATATFAAPLARLGMGAPSDRRLQARDGRSGPGNLTVAYSPSLGMMRRVVEGFRSEDHRVSYSVLGIQVADAADGGARVTKVFEDTPAGRAGVKEGDVLVSMGDFPVGGRNDFLRAILRVNP